jgi:hypothetical protein
MDRYNSKALLQIIIKLHKIQSNGKCYSFYEYSGHVDELHYRLLRLDTVWDRRVETDIIIEGSISIEELKDEYYNSIITELDKWV